jgi:hypothetical protein
MFLRKCIDFCVIDDDTLLAASQQVENEWINSCNLDNRCMADWSDFVSDSELVSASQLFEIPKSELVASKEQPSGRFRTPITDNELRVLQLSRFPKKTIDNSIWAVTLFGEWRDRRNRRCQLTI